VEFIQTNILDKKERNKLAKFNLIVSNPPYVTEDDKKIMRKNVTYHEPHLALFVSNNNPLLFYRAIADFAKNHLFPKGTLWFEINESFGNNIYDLLQSNGFINIKLHKDIYGKTRFVSCTKTI